MVCLSVLATARDLQNDNIHTEILMAQIASGHDPMGRAVVESTSDGTAIVLQGRIGGGSADALQSVLDATPNATTLILDSKGGRITEAADIAIRVKQRQLDTMVRNQCLSACTYIFLAGMHRVATANASLGFHQPSLPGQTPIGKWMSTQHMREYYRAAGLRDWFVDRVIATEPKDVWIPTKSDLAAAGVLTSPLGRP